MGTRAQKVCKSVMQGSKLVNKTLSCLLFPCRRYGGADALRMWELLPLPRLFGNPMGNRARVPVQLSPAPATHGSCSHCCFTCPPCSSLCLQRQ